MGLAGILWAVYAQPPRLHHPYRGWGVARRMWQPSVALLVRCVARAIASDISSQTRMGSWLNTLGTNA